MSRKYECDQDVVRKFLDFIKVPDACVELRILASRHNHGVTRPGTQTFGGFYKDLDRLTLDIASLEGVSGYVTINPIDEALFVQENERIMLRGSGETSSDTHVKFLRWIFVDIDSVRPTKVSATDSERQSAIDLQNEIFTTYPEIQASSIWGNSGNGCWILVRLGDIPNVRGDEAAGRFLKQLSFLSNEFAKVDTSTKNPARIMGIPGTWKCKGSDTPDRPYRISTVESQKLINELISFDIEAWLATNETVKVAPSPKRNSLPAVVQPLIANVVSGEPTKNFDGKTPLESYIARTVENVSSEVRYAAPKDGNNAINRAAFRLGTIAGNGPDYLDRDHAYHEIYNAAKARSPERPDSQIEKTFNSGWEDGILCPCDLSNIGVGFKPQIIPVNQLHHIDLDDPDTIENLPVSSDGRIEVLINEDRHVVLDLVTACLHRNARIFRRGSSLVTVSVDEKRTVLQRVGEHTLSCYLTETFWFYIFKSKGEELVKTQVHPPTWLAKSLVDGRSFPMMREISGITETTFVRSNGTLVSEPGWDRETEYYVKSVEGVEKIIEYPSRNDARNAAERIFKLVEQFPFTSNADRAAWLSALLTVVNRPGINDCTPGFVINSNKAGTGKGKLVDIIGCIATGRKIDVTPFPQKDEEIDKLKTTFAMSGTSVVHFDNAPNGSTYGSGPLDSMITSSTINNRILGENRSTGDMPLRCFWFITGNNISPVKDAHRRWLTCNLSTKLENPEERSDISIKDIIQHTKDNRTNYLIDALTILRAHAVAGYPSGSDSQLGSFESWDKIVRGAVWYATGLDCTTTRREAKQNSREYLRTLELFEGWKSYQEQFPDQRGHKISTILAHLDKGMSLGEEPHPLFSALSNYGRNGNLPSPNVIGRILTELKDTPFEGHKIVQVGKPSGTILWHIDPID